MADPHDRIRELETQLAGLRETYADLLDRYDLVSRARIDADVSRDAAQMQAEILTQELAEWRLGALASPEPHRPRGFRMFRSGP